jgi:hypothetical protein
VEAEVMRPVVKSTVADADADGFNVRSYASPWWRTIVLAVPDVVPV